MTDTRPESVPGSKPDPAKWLPVREALRFHYERTPRTRPMHRSTFYRQVHNPDHPVRGEWFGGELFIERASLEAFCRNGRPRRGRRTAAAATSGSQQAAAALDRIRRKHGVAPEVKGGEAA